MNSVIVAIFQTIPFVIVIMMAALFVLYAGATITWPRLLVYPYLALIVTVSGNSYGIKELVAVSVYSRGSGLLYFSATLWLVLIAFLWARFSTAFSKFKPWPCSLYPWFFGWFVLLLAHFAWALIIDVPAKEALAALGFSNIVWMAALIALVLAAFRTPIDVEELTRFLVLVGLGRAAFGLVRWAAFGGDPANIYANSGGALLKLTFFDINDSVVCMLALSISGLRLFKSKAGETNRWWRLIYWVTLFATAACIALSFRRTAWVGFSLGGLVLLTQVPANRRVQAFLLAVPVSVAVMGYGAWKRLSQTRGAGGLEAFFFDVQTNRMGVDTPRMLELKLAFGDFLANPVMGLGAWGRYTGNQLIAWQEGEGAGGFVHSGILHVAFKAGLVGLALLVGLYFAYFRFIGATYRAVDDSRRPLYFAGFASVVMMLPDMVIGTPIPQVRTMQMFALCLALPYLAFGVSRKAGASTPQKPAAASRRLESSAKSNHGVSGSWQPSS